MMLLPHPRASCQRSVMTHEELGDSRSTKVETFFMLVHFDGVKPLGTEITRREKFFRIP